MAGCAKAPVVAKVAATQDRRRQHLAITPAGRGLLRRAPAVVQDRLDPFSRFVTRLATRRKMDDKAEGEAALRASGLRWVIVYATVLTDAPPRGVRVVPDSGRVGLRDTTSRADAASFLLDAATRDDYDRRSILITGK